MPTAHANGIDLHYERSGASTGGEPLLLIMGMSGSHLSWGPRFVELLGERYDVVTYDHRGIGASSPLDGTPFTIADLAADALGLLDALGWESAHMCGISMGGMVAQELALAASERVRGLVLGCTMAGGSGAVHASPEDFRELTAAMSSGDVDRALRTTWEINVSAAFAADEAEYAAFKERAFEVRAPLATIMAQMQAIGGFDTTPRLAGIEAPTLVVHGTDDRMLPAANATALVEGIPDARLELLDGIGHMFFVEAPQPSAALVLEHLAAASAAAPAA